MPDSPDTNEPAALSPPAPTSSTTTSSNKAKSTRASRRPPNWLLIVVAALASYILSIGPMFWTWHYAEHFGGNELIRVFYTPLRLLCEIPVFEDLINRYIRWWIL
jgi:hypothetical protein